MNDPRSMMIGWGCLLFAAGSGYYFARKDLNERRREQAKQGLRGPAMDWRERIEQQNSKTSGATPEADSASRSTTASSANAKAVASTSTKTPPKEPPESANSSS